LKENEQNIKRNSPETQSSENNKALIYQSQKMEALGTLVAGVAHEINNPVNLIIYNIPLLSKVWQDIMPFIEAQAEDTKDLKFGGLPYGFLKQNLPKLLSDTDMAANRVAQIVKELKNYSRQSNVTEMESIEVNLAVKNAVRLAQSTLKNANVKLETRLSESLPQINGNIQSIEQVLLNLIINAIQAIHHTEGKITITTDYEIGKDLVTIAISDNGKGINPSISEKLFDPFVTDKHDEGGTGLGLSVSYSLIKTHEGEITFHSEQGEGTTFIISLPIFARKTKSKILIADDDMHIQNLLTDAITSRNIYRIENAYNGIEACIKLGSYQPDLLILDIFMPEMDGVEVCRAIKKDPELSNLKVIITTGFPDHPKLEEASKLGFTTIYSKPFGLIDFLDEIDGLLLKNKESD